MTSQSYMFVVFHPQSINIHGLSHVHLVSDKSRLAPMTMPGLYPQAASMDSCLLVVYVQYSSFWQGPLGWCNGV